MAGRPPRALLLTLAIAVAPAAAGCDADPPRVTLEAYGVEGRAALCAWAVRCRHAPDEATCRRVLDPRRFDTRRAADGVRLGRLAYDPEAAGRCLAAGRDAACPAAPFADPSCDRVFTGLVPEGGVCTTAFDCAGGGPCMEPACDAGCCAGTCGPPPPAKEPPVRSEAGGPCQTHTDCVDTAFCDIDGRCHDMPREAGQHCLLGCYFGDLFCEVDSETCQPYAALGQACGPAARCNDAYAYCDGVCRPRPDIGQPCDGELRRCIPSLICAGGVCAGRLPPGSRCDGEGQCDVACDLDAGTCVPYETCDP